MLPLHWSFLEPASLSPSLSLYSPLHLFLSLLLCPFCNMWCISFKCKAANCMLKLLKHKIGRTSLAFLGGMGKKGHSTADCLTRHLWGVGVPVYNRALVEGQCTGNMLHMKIGTFQEVVNPANIIMACCTVVVI